MEWKSTWARTLLVGLEVCASFLLSASFFLSVLAKQVISWECGSRRGRHEAVASRERMKELERHSMNGKQRSQAPWNSSLTTKQDQSVWFYLVTFSWIDPGWVGRFNQSWGFRQQVQPGERGQVHIICWLKWWTMGFEIYKEDQCKGRVEGLLRLGYWRKWAGNPRGVMLKEGFMKQDLWRNSKYWEWTIISSM